VLDYGALEAGLRSGRFGGAVLDVFEAEPVPPGHALWNCPNLIMTPHCSLDDHARYLDGCLALFAANLERYLGGRPLENLVDKARGY
jgi:phosphoglycerate dehydrogenase-like enzyme